MESFFTFGRYISNAFKSPVEQLDPGDQQGHGHLATHATLVPWLVRRGSDGSARV